MEGAKEVEVYFFLLLSENNMCNIENRKRFF